MISLDSTSEPSKKRKGERGSPCLRPLFGENKPTGEPSKRTEKETVEMHCSINQIHLELKPKLDKIFKMKLYSIRSKAFSISSFNAIRAPLPLFFFIEWKISCARIELS